MPRRVPDHRGVLLGLLLGCEAEASRCVDAETFWSATDARCVAGDLVVQGRSDDEVAALAELEQVTGNLAVFANPGLTALPAMPRLTHLGGSLSIADNAALADVGGFPGLVELVGSVFVAENPVLHTFELGPAVTSLRSLDITANPRLTQLRGMSGLARVTGGVRIARNDALTAIDLPSLAEVDTLTIEDDAALEQIDLPALRTIARTMTLSRVGRLESLAGFASLREIGERVDITGNSALTEIEWRAESTGELWIENNEALRAVRGAATVTEVGGSLGITRNPALAAIEGFEALTSIRDLVVADNAGLQTLAGMPGPTHMAGLLRIQDNPQLLAPTAWLAALTRVDGSLWIVDNASLAVEAVDALLAHLEVGGAVRVGDNGGEDTALDPCPWINDYYCDAGRDTDLCLTDAEDCGE